MNKTLNIEDGSWVRVREPGIYPWQGLYCSFMGRGYVRDCTGRRFTVHDAMTLEVVDEISRKRAIENK